MREVSILIPGEPTDHAAAEFAQARGQECAIKEPLRILIIVGRPAVADVVEMDGEFGRIQAVGRRGDPLSA